MDPSFSQKVADNRWNTKEFPALYCCCSERVAKAIVVEHLRRGSIELADLSPELIPQLVELEWSGTVVDAASEEGLAAAGLPTTYPKSVLVQQCQHAAMTWYKQKVQGVLCRSAAVHRIWSPQDWREPHQPWGEVAIYTNNTRVKPTLSKRRDDQDWLRPEGAMS